MDEKLTFCEQRTERERGEGVEEREREGGGGGEEEKEEEEGGGENSGLPFQRF